MFMLVPIYSILINVMVTRNIVIITVIGIVVRVIFIVILITDTTLDVGNVIIEAAKNIIMTITVINIVNIRDIYTFIICISIVVVIIEKVDIRRNRITIIINLTIEIINSTTIQGVTFL